MLDLSKHEEAGQYLEGDFFKTLNTLLANLEYTVNIKTFKRLFRAMCVHNTLLPRKVKKLEENIGELTQPDFLDQKQGYRISPSFVN